MARDREEVRILTTEEFAVFEQLKEAREAKKEWAEQEERARKALLDAVGSASQLYYGGNYVADVIDKVSSRFDRKTFAKDWPKLDEEYRTEMKSTQINFVGDGPEANEAA